MIPSMAHLCGSLPVFFFFFFFFFLSCKRNLESVSSLLSVSLSLSLSLLHLCYSSSSEKGIPPLVDYVHTHRHTLVAAVFSHNLELYSSSVKNHVGLWKDTQAFLSYIARNVTSKGIVCVLFKSSSIVH